MFGILDAEIIGITYFTLFLFENDEDDAKFLFFFLFLKIPPSILHIINIISFLTIL